MSSTHRTPHRGHGRQVALLRGINVGGKNMLSMKELVALFEELGCNDVRTYIQSGNVIFTAAARLAQRVPASAAAAIRHRFGYDVPVVTRTAAELQAVARTNPFLKAGADPATLHVAFLATKPSAARTRELDPQRSPGDAFYLRGRDIYLHLANGVARTKITNAWLDRSLDTVSTVRNWRTVAKLIALCEV